MSVLIDQEEKGFFVVKTPLLTVGFGLILTQKISIGTCADHISTKIAAVLVQVVGTNERFSNDK